MTKITRIDGLPEHSQEEAARLLEKYRRTFPALAEYFSAPAPGHLPEGAAVLQAHDEHIVEVPPGKSFRFIMLDVYGNDVQVLADREVAVDGKTRPAG